MAPEKRMVTNLTVGALLGRDDIADLVEALQRGDNPIAKAIVVYLDADGDIGSGAIGSVTYLEAMGMLSWASQQAFCQCADDSDGKDDGGVPDDESTDD